MPHKFNAVGRDHILKRTPRVTNWSDYNEGLRRRWDLTIWICETALDQWSAPQRRTRGGQLLYSDLAIELCLTLGTVFKQALRQTQGFMRSIAKLLVINIEAPDFSTLSRRGNKLVLQKKPRVNSNGAIHLAVSSTGIKIFVEGECLKKKHKNKGRRKGWRKLHLGLDLTSGEIICSELTTDDVGDPTALPDLLDQIEGLVDLFLADGVYNASPPVIFSSSILAQPLRLLSHPLGMQSSAPIWRHDPTLRGYDIAHIQANGRIAWQKDSGYNQRSRGETLMGRWKDVIGPKLKASSFENQKAEIKIDPCNNAVVIGEHVFD